MIMREYKAKILRSVGDDRVASSFESWRDISPSILAPDGRAMMGNERPEPPASDRVKSR